MKKYSPAVNNTCYLLLMYKQRSVYFLRSRRIVTN